ncbi:hypothetical protein [Alicyclobacillus acidiphilus]|uniref:hypothetical protein n=1 Tax=Alicyclobacillus acidiphilus TaxID=182455 RepID=UPI00082FA094|nr:hypothetical protein [Alicyclobacillus acidiphilus]
MVYLRKSMFKSKNRKRRFWTLLLIVPLFVGLSVVAFEVYEFLNPFQNLNPLHHEVTLGEEVIGDWIYAGMNDNGDIVFSNNHNDVPVLIPENSHEFALDGKTYIVDRATRNSLTFSDPIESLPFQRFFQVILLLLIVILVVCRIRKKRILNLNIRRVRKFKAKK